MTTKTIGNEIKEFSIWYIDEKKVNISYPTIDKKGKRPFLILKKMKNNKFLVAPFTKKKDEHVKINNSLSSFEITLRGNNSIILLSDLYILSLEEIIENGELYPFNFTRGQISKINHSIAMLFIGQYYGASKNKIENITLYFKTYNKLKNNPKIIILFDSTMNSYINELKLNLKHKSIIYLNDDENKKYNHEFVLDPTNMNKNDIKKFEEYCLNLINQDKSVVIRIKNN